MFYRSVQSTRQSVGASSQFVNVNLEMPGNTRASCRSPDQIYGHSARPIWAVFIYFASRIRGYDSHMHALVV